MIKNNSGKNACRINWGKGAVLQNKEREGL